MTRAELTEKITAIRRTRRLSWRALARDIGSLSPIFCTAALLGQMKLEKSEAEAAGRLLGLDEDEVLLLQDVPYRGALPTAVPTDPLIYRFYELLQVYGPTWKALIEEEFGDGIMSAIDFDMSLERQADAKGDRVRLTLSGKFLAYKRY